MAVIPKTPNMRLRVLLSGGEIPQWLGDLLLGLDGMDGISLSADPISLGSDAVVYDMIYAPPETPLLAAAKRRGLRFANGLGMLAAQGERAFTIWTGVTPPQELMKAVLIGDS